jgi:hypothetical protein
MEARVGLELGEAAHQRDLGGWRPARDPDDQVGAIGERQQVAEGLAVLDKDDAAQGAGERELDLVDLRRPQVALPVAERPAQFNDPVVLRDQLREGLSE